MRSRVGVQEHAPCLCGWADDTGRCSWWCRSAGVANGGKEEKSLEESNSFFHFPFYSVGLIQNLQAKVAVHGVKLIIPGLETAVAAAEPSPIQKGLQHILAEICRLELNGNLHSELEQIVTREKMHLQDDPLLNGLLDSSELKTCLDVALENVTSHRMKIVEVSWKPRMGP